MLKKINIKNIAVIEEAEIDFSEKFNVLTGETGAGKSIIIDSLNAVLGERTSKELIRTGCPEATVSALFTDVSEEICRKIAELGFETPEGEVLLQKILKADGKSSCRVNGAISTAATLKTIGKMLVNIHGQHDSQALLDKESHIHYIDAYAENSELIADYYKSFKLLCDTRRELKNLKAKTDEEKRLVELYKFNVREIEAAGVKPGERDELNQRKTVLLNSEKIASALSSAAFLLSGDDENGGAVSGAENAARQLGAVSDSLKSASKISENLLNLSSLLGDAAAEVSDLAASVKFDKNELDLIEERLSVLYDITQKYGPAEEDALRFLEEAKEKIGAAQDGEEKINELSKIQDTLEEEVYLKGQKLTKSRVAASEKFAKKVCGVLQFLEMPDVVFKINADEGSYTKFGCDRLEFLVSANRGEEPRPLSKIASGGELSRIMLAIKSVLAEKDDVNTLIFDEIDTGISGRAAGKVGSQLKTLAETHQVICVTHLAQIAAGGDNHLLIEKSAVGGRTSTVVKPLGGDERIREIARIISGGEITESLYNTAKELINNCSGGSARAMNNNNI